MKQLLLINVITCIIFLTWFILVSLKVNNIIFNLYFYLKPNVTYIDTYYFSGIKIYTYSYLIDLTDDIFHIDDEK